MEVWEKQESAIFQKSKERIIREEKMDKGVATAAWQSEPRTEKGPLPGTFTQLFGRSFHRVTDIEDKQRG